MSDPHILFIDNFDSFTFNLVDALSAFSGNVDVYRNDLSVDEVLAIAAEKQSAMIVLSPGPGTPADAGCTVPLVRAAAGRYPLFGICLGHQAIAEAFGGVVGSAGDIVHGKKSKLSHGGHPLFAGLPQEFAAGRYHSLTVQKMPEELETIAECDGLVMALAHKNYPIYGVQFHPESVLTTQGQLIMGNALQLALQYKSNGN